MSHPPVTADFNAHHGIHPGHIEWNPGDSHYHYHGLFYGHHSTGTPVDSSSSNTTDSAHSAYAVNSAKASSGGSGPWVTPSDCHSHLPFWPTPESSGYPGNAYSISGHSGHGHIPSGGIPPVA